ncbi:hypothetical protein GW796_05850 [archaeon]|nr:hypothetical protein [archaeon]NCQ51407.1 hypothetical protein [archaeon]NCT58767.1 hypothetical protein [archaeon]
MAVSDEVLLELEFKKKNGIKLSREEKLILKENDKEAKEKKSKMSLGERLLNSSKSKYAQLMGDDNDDKFPIRDWISTGNYLFNAQISGDYKKGVPSGRVSMFAGVQSTGKSYLALETLKNAQELGYFGVIFDSEMANNNKDDLKGRGIDTERLLFIPVDTVENLKTSMLNLIDEVGEDDKIFMIVDSIGNLSTNKEIEDSTEGNTTKDMSRAAQLKSLFRTVTLRSGVKNIPIIAINHTYAIIGGFFSGGQQIAGGSGGLYNASIIAEFSKSQEKGKDGKTMTGALVTSTVSKCRTAKERTKVKFTIDFDNGLAKTSGLELFCSDEKIINKVGRSWIFSEETNYKQGEKFTTITDEIWEEFLDLYLGKYLHNKFSYQSISNSIGLDEEESE